MVAKISYGSSMFGALSYNQQKVDEKHAHVILTNRIIEPKDGNYTIGGCMRSFDPYLAANLKTEKPVIHISLNPSPDDKLSNEQYAEIAAEYMEKLGYGNQPYCVFKHEDIGRHHIHIVSVRVDEEGRKLKDSFEFQRSKDITRELELKYGLHPVNKKEQSETYLLKKVDPDAGDIKRQLSNTLKSLVKSYKFQSIGEYNALLSSYNIRMEEVKGEIKGKQFNGLLYSATNDNGEKVGNPIKSSRIGKVVGYDALLRKMERSKTALKSGPHKDRLKTEISTLMRDVKPKEEFTTALKTKGIDVVFRENDAGRIYGATFIDHQGQVVFNGSRLGKEFSANVFNDYFNGNIQPDFKDNHQEQSHDTSPMKENHQDPLFDLTVGNVIGELIDILPINESAYEENSQFPKTKKKKKRRFGRQF